MFYPNLRRFVTSCLQLHLTAVICGIITEYLRPESFGNMVCLASRSFLKKKSFFARFQYFNLSAYNLIVHRANIKPSCLLSLTRHYEANDERGQQIRYETLLYKDGTQLRRKTGVYTIDTRTKWWVQDVNAQIGLEKPLLGWNKKLNQKLTYFNPNPNLLNTFVCGDFCEGLIKHSWSLNDRESKIFFVCILHSYVWGDINRNGFIIVS
jgi:hypothetical protein